MIQNTHLDTCGLDAVPGNIEYRRDCLACMMRLVKSARSADKKTSRRAQDGLLAWMGEAMAAKVIQRLKDERQSDAR